MFDLVTWGAKTPLKDSIPKMIENFRALKEDGVVAPDYHSHILNVKLMTSANVTLSGEQVIDAVQLRDGDIICVNGQADVTKNGIYIVRLLAWEKESDELFVYPVGGANYVGQIMILAVPSPNAHYDKFNSGFITASGGLQRVVDDFSLTNTGVAAGTYGKMTVDAKGRITAGMALAATDIPSLDASKITTGVIDIARLPASAVERVVVVATQVARYALTTATVQNGDVVKQTDTGLMYYVKDETNLANANGYEVFSAGTAASVPWSGVTSKPTTLAGYGITDSTPSSHVGATGEAHGVATTSVAGFESAADKTKLDGIATGAEVNQNTFSHITDGTYTASASSKTDTLKLRSANNILAVEVANDDAIHGDNVLFTVNQGNIDHGSLAGLTDDDHPQYIKHSSAPAANYVLVSTGIGSYSALDASGVAFRTALGLKSAAFTHASDYAPENKGVTNGDNHDHNLGDGAQIDHVNLGGIGLNTHPQIDDHIGNRSNPHYVTPSQVGAVAVNEPIVGKTAIKITYDSKGLVTDGASLTVADIPDLDASKITTGTIDIARLPATALERLVVVANQAARFALTPATIQVGDTVKEADTGSMYFVVDVANLTNVAGYQMYTAGSAASVPWSGVTSKPTSLAGYGITDAVPSSHVGAGGTAHGVVTTTLDGFMSTADKIKLNGIGAGANVTNATTVGVSITGATAKTTPVDADTVPLIDSAASNVLSKVTWANIKATLKTYFDSLYALTGHLHTATYAPIAKGVTNGDTHDHAGGDGAQIDHVNLTNKGTNTHAQLDAHVAATAPHTGHATNAYVNIAVAGQSTMNANTAATTLTLVAGANCIITTNPATNEVTINAGGSGSMLSSVVASIIFDT